MAQKQLKNFGFMQYIEPKYWNWSKDEKSKYMVDTQTMIEHIYNRILEGLKSAGASSAELEFKFSCIEHDKDTTLLWDPKKEIEVIEPKEPHLHGFVELTKKRDLNVVAKWVGVEPQYIDIPRGRYGRPNMLAYLIHAKDPSKYLYDPEDVETCGTWDYFRYYQENIMDWDRQRATKSVKENKVQVDWLVKQVQYGKLTLSDIMDNESYKIVYADNMRLIKDAQDFANEERAHRTVKALERNEFALSVIYVTGMPGAGKSYFARELCKKLERENGWRTYEASGSHPMDNYSAEEILFLDDLRSSAMGATDWLKMLDQLSRSTLAARYNNKGRAYRTIIMTAYEDPYSYFGYMKGNGGSDEALAQFIRRLLYTVSIYRLDNSDRVAFIEEIVQGYHRYYHMRLKKFLNRPPYFSERDIKATNFYGHPIALLNADSAVERLCDTIAELNDPNKDHSNIERRTLNDAKSDTFINNTGIDENKLLGN